MFLQCTLTGLITMSSTYYAIQYKNKIMFENIDILGMDYENLTCVFMNIV